MRLIYYIDVTVWCVVAFYALRRWNESPTYLVAITLAFLTFALWVTARIQLGASFKIRAEAHQLVTRGLYSRLRNPIYTFAFISYNCLFVALRAWLAIPIFALVYVGQLRRIRNEEQVLESAFGDEYRAYKARTWF